MAMKRQNVMAKLKRKSLEFLTAGAMAIGSMTACDKGPTDPTQTNQSPIASFSVNPKEGSVPLTTSFNASSSRDPDGTISKYVWDFGDGKKDSTSGPNVQHMYSNPGNYSPKLTVYDNKGAQAGTKDVVNAIPVLNGHLEGVLNGIPVSNQEVSCGLEKGTTDVNGDFKMPMKNCNLLTVNSSQFYNLKMPVVDDGKNKDLGNVQMIERYTDPVNNSDLLDFMKTYMQSGRWADSDLPIKVFVDNNPPSTDYANAVKQGIMSWGPAVNQWLPQGRKLSLAEFVDASAKINVTALYDNPNLETVSFSVPFKEASFDMNPTMTGQAISSASAHMFGHLLFGINPSPFDHSPYSNHLMKKAFPLPNIPSDFEGLVVATKYKLKNGTVDNYSP